MSGRSLRDSIVALQVDKPDGDGFEVNTLKTPGFTGTYGDGLLTLCGFTAVEESVTGRVELLVVNNRPSVDSETGELLDQAITGANATIDLFETGAAATELKFIRSYADQRIATPNRVAAISSDKFYISNDHGKHKTGIVSNYFH